MRVIGKTIRYAHMSNRSYERESKDVLFKYQIGEHPATNQKLLTLFFHSEINIGIPLAR